MAMEIQTLKQILTDTMNAAIQILRNNYLLMKFQILGTNYYTYDKHGHRNPRLTMDLTETPLTT